MFFAINFLRIAILGILVLVFEMIDFKGCESVSFWINYSSDSLSLSSVVIRNASKRFGETNCGRLFNGLILTVFLGIKNYCFPLLKWLFCLAVSFTVWSL